MKDIKTKSSTAPKSAKVSNAPKVAVKSKEFIVNGAKDAALAAKDKLIRQNIEKKLADNMEQRQSDRPENYAVDSVENIAVSTAKTAYHKSKNLIQNGNRIKTREVAEDSESCNYTHSVKTSATQPKTVENYKKQMLTHNEKAAEQVKNSARQKTGVKTKEQYLHTSTENGAASDRGIKTKANYIQERERKSNQSLDSNHSSASDNMGADKQKKIRRKYVSDKLKSKADFEHHQTDGRTTAENSNQDFSTVNLPKEKKLTTVKQGIDTASAEKPKSLVKTKESYIHSLRESTPDPIKSPYSNSKLPKAKKDTQVVKRGASNSSKALKTRNNVVGKSRAIVKSGNSHTKNAAKRRTQKTVKKAVKTQKEVAKRVAKEAAKRARQAAKVAAKATKAAVKLAVKIAIKIAQAIAAAVKALVSALASLGWVGLLIVVIVLIVIIIVAAVAASPYGVYISDEAADASSISISSIIAECNVELSTQLDIIEDSTSHNRVVMEGTQANWNEVIAVFAVMVAGVDDGTAEDVVIITEAKKQKLKAVFWNMNDISSRVDTVQTADAEERVLYITITAKSANDMVNEYHFTDKQQETLTTLLENNEILTSVSQSLTISDGTAQEILKNISPDLPENRKAVLKAACSLVGKVNYFWGGKSSAIGWDSEWGKMKLVTAEGSHSSGSMRPFGLDCSGFVTWSFINAGMNANAIGHGTQGQIAKCTRILWSEAQAGDLAFLSDLSHVGIIAGRDIDGNILVIHCSSGANNVVITTNSIFGFAARPNCY